MKALELGAVDFVAKPKVGVSDGLRQLGHDITEKIRCAAQARVHRLPTAAPAAGATPVRAPTSIGHLSTEKIIFIGASTGGTEATRDVLTRLPADAPAVMITQHMPPGFTRSYAARLAGLCRIRVAEATDGERVLPGHAYIAPGGFHMSVERSGANYIARVRDGEPVNRHKPSVEVLFQSAARVVGRNAVGVMLTGMGGDGAAAMREMREAGAWNVSQDEASCVVYGMPREAVAHGAVHEVLPLSRIAERLIERLRQNAGGSLSRV
jgi:two-component system chemotaxis response regulator CheB